MDVERIFERNLFEKMFIFFLINASNILENQLYNEIETSINIPEFFSDFLTI